MRSDEAGWVLLEAVALGMIVLATVAAVGIFARTALLREHAAARMEAALLARAQISVMEAALDQGIPPAGGRPRFPRTVSPITLRRRLYVQQSFTMYACVFRGRFWDAGRRRNTYGG